MGIWEEVVTRFESLYCCRVDWGESLISASIDQSFSVIILNENSEETTINFVSRTKRNYSVTISHL